MFIPKAQPLLQPARYYVFNHNSHADARKVMGGSVWRFGELLWWELWGNQGKSSGDGYFLAKIDGDSGVGVLFVVALPLIQEMLNCVHNILMTSEYKNLGFLQTEFGRDSTTLVGTTIWRDRNYELLIRGHIQRLAGQLLMSNLSYLFLNFLIALYNLN